MSIEKKLREDLKSAIKQQDTARKSAIRVIIGELNRAQTKELDDQKIIKTIKKLIKSEEEGRKDKSFIDICNEYLPREISAEDIESWIRANIDFTQYKNKMQSMKDIMTHFKGQANGNVVKSIIERM